MIERLSKKDSKLVMAHMYVAICCLILGGLAGLLQTFVRSGLLQLPKSISYYQILTVHGIVLALVLTTFFIIGFQYSAVAKTAGNLSPLQRKLGWIGFWVMVVGTAMAATMVLLNKATVLYTFYAPLKAHVIFYVGMALVVVGSWISVSGQILKYAEFKKKNPGKKSPLLSYMVTINDVMWIVCSLGVASTVLFQLIPWSLGLVERVDVSLSRTLFWYFGHALVYFWLLPAYMCWYAIVPKIIGAKAFSDNLARMSFMLFLFFSIPVGIHHQLVEPGIDDIWKYFQVILTFMVVVPSFMTAFSLFATFENYGRSLGYKGLFGWFKSLPWNDARFVLPFLGMLAFIPGGAGGLVNASAQMNGLIHNTIWVTGHFHLTVASAVILTFFGMMYWLIPHCTGRKLTKFTNKLAIIQGYTWAIGMTVMSGAMHYIGLVKGAPRRSAFSTYGGSKQAAEWVPYQILQAVGGTILFISIILVVMVFIHLVFLSPKGDEEYPVAEALDQDAPVIKFAENWRFLIIVTVLLILIAYTFPIGQMFTDPPPGAKGMGEGKLW
ncbi:MULTISPECIES: b(o/a)3-type cytochrome-c oxidase subunit 1 [Mammaliicoccus]|uniref:b(o/a)3-type cytochrome-c oxidase subunit 1 n=1 Tax=Mammaliicoccus TaxID=2803850 RepID=UPI001071DA4F|nr:MULTISPECIES: b(o/a)3-type cytochrome-c oxidase subunit 1 [Mammaliicoccus]MBF0747802.1 b(o/a)3-type cytochrome-c oxidase subunit 1 [Mammaliicoccus lentus]MEB5685745.1 b(o/a)3-type cytochrome-c oxidase subunit 1 [Mammaliicoccus lentus]TFU59635.1 b(o/a)3-type cytochrome-c oxidase subunit 1 [Mammaliicoccus lentus]WQL54688.1 b(o/a)3-type cytochrome-c oxidase subunit 1 [Mammaliicoccus lentus]HJF22021.1 b(o/a)3-type cytochrome-c oxidase subunit 1 [Mammaliicoccus lentus]